MLFNLLLQIVSEAYRFVIQLLAALIIVKPFIPKIPSDTDLHAEISHSHSIDVPYFKVDTKINPEPVDEEPVGNAA